MNPQITILIPINLKKHWNMFMQIKNIIIKTNNIYIRHYNRLIDLGLLDNLMLPGFIHN